MNDQHRNAYLAAIGIDRYLSRAQLPGAAQTIRRDHAPAMDALPVETVAPVPISRPGTLEVPKPAAPQSVKAPRRQPSSNGDSSPVVPPTETPAQAVGVPRFSLATIVAGKWLWVEDLAGMPLAREQVQLVQAMAGALQNIAGSTTVAKSGSKPDIAQFDWPMHSNEQLDLGTEAAGAALSSFLRRRLELGDLGLVFLGEAAAQRVPSGQLSCDQVILRYSSTELLAQPELKKQTWSDLRSFLGRS